MEKTSESTDQIREKNKRTYDEVMSSYRPPRKMLPEKERKVVVKMHRYMHEKAMNRVSEVASQCQVSQTSTKTQTRTVPACKSVHTQTYTEDVNEDYYGDYESE